MLSMTVLNQRKMRDDKITRLKEGHCVYAESTELIRLLKRGIKKESLDVQLDKSDGGCWFTPNG